MPLHVTLDRCNFLEHPRVCPDVTSETGLPPSSVGGAQWTPIGQIAAGSGGSSFPLFSRSGSRISTPSSYALAFRGEGSQEEIELERMCERIHTTVGVTKCSHVVTIGGVFSVLRGAKIARIEGNENEEETDAQANGAVGGGVKGKARGKRYKRYRVELSFPRPSSGSLLCTPSGTTTNQDKADAVIPQSSSFQDKKMNSSHLYYHPELIRRMQCFGMGVLSGCQRKADTVGMSFLGENNANTAGATAGTKKKMNSGILPSSFLSVVGGKEKSSLLRLRGTQDNPFAVATGSDKKKGMEEQFLSSSEEDEEEDEASDIDEGRINPENGRRRKRERSGKISSSSLLSLLQKESSILLSREEKMKKRKDTKGNLQASTAERLHFFPSDISSAVEQSEVTISCISYLHELQSVREEVKKFREEAEAFVDRGREFSKIFVQPSSSLNEREATTLPEKKEKDGNESQQQQRTRTTMASSLRSSGLRALNQGRLTTTSRQWNFSLFNNVFVARGPIFSLPELLPLTQVENSEETKKKPISFASQAHAVPDIAVFRKVQQLIFSSTYQEQLGFSVAQGGGDRGSPHAAAVCGNSLPSFAFGCKARECVLQEFMNLLDSKCSARYQKKEEVKRNAAVAGEYAVELQVQFSLQRSKSENFLTPSSGIISPAKRTVAVPDGGGTTPSPSYSSLKTKEEMISPVNNHHPQEGVVTSATCDYSRTASASKQLEIKPTLIVPSIALSRREQDEHESTTAVFLHKTGGKNAQLLPSLTNTQHIKKVFIQSILMTAEGIVRNEEEEQKAKKKEERELRFRDPLLRVGADATYAAMLFFLHRVLLHSMWLYVHSQYGPPVEEEQMAGKSAGKTTKKNTPEQFSSVSFLRLEAQLLRIFPVPTSRVLLLEVATVRDNEEGKNGKIVWEFLVEGLGIAVSSETEKKN